MIFKILNGLFGSKNDTQTEENASANPSVGEPNGQWQPMQPYGEWGDPFGGPPPVSMENYPEKSPGLPKDKATVQRNQSAPKRTTPWWKQILNSGNQKNAGAMGNRVQTPPRARAGQTPQQQMQGQLGRRQSPGFGLPQTEQRGMRMPGGHPQNGLGSNGFGPRMGSQTQRDPWGVPMQRGGYPQSGGQRIAARYRPLAQMPRHQTHSGMIPNRNPQGQVRQRRDPWL